LFYSCDLDHDPMTDDLDIRTSREDSKDVPAIKNKLPSEGFQK